MSDHVSIGSNLDDLREELGSSGGSFNGGTITEPLTVNDGDVDFPVSDPPSLLVLATNEPPSNFPILIEAFAPPQEGSGGGVINVFTVDAGGEVGINANDAEAIPFLVAGAFEQSADLVWIGDRGLAHKMFKIDANGAVAIAPTAIPSDGMLVVKAPTGTDPENGESAFRAEKEDGGSVFEVTTSGAVSINPQAPDFQTFFMFVPEDQTAENILLRSTPGNADLFAVKANGAVAVAPSDDSTAALTITPNGSAAAFDVTGKPEIPATPGPQDVVDALVALGLVTQAAP